MTGLSAFPLPFQSSSSPAFATPRTLRELQMMQCSAQLRAKPAWFDKMNDAEIAARWTREAVAQGLTEAQVRYVLAELGYYAALRDGRTGIEVSAVDGVWQSDSLVDEQLRTRLREAVRVLEEVPEAERDWHPGSMRQGAGPRASLTVLPGEGRERRPRASLAEPDEALCEVRVLGEVPVAAHRRRRQ